MPPFPPRIIESKLGVELTAESTTIPIGLNHNILFSVLIFSS